MARTSKNKTIAEEYIISIIPELDQEKFNKAREKVKEITKTNKKEKSEYQKKKEEIQLNALSARERIKTEKEIVKLNREQFKLLKDINKEAQKTGMSDIASIVASASAIIAILKVSFDVMKELAENAKDFSNSMITAGSAFVNKNTRNLMARFGVSGQTATGMQSVMNLMGITTEDFKMMTPAQMQLYSRLMGQWQEGMNSIGNSKMQEFNKTMQTMQSALASAKLELQIEFYRLLVDLAPEIEDFYKSIISLIRSLAELMSSPLVKAIIATLSGLISGVVRIVSALARVLAFDFSGAWDALNGSDNISNTTNYYSISATSTNTFTGDTSSMYAIATQTQQDEINSIASTLNSTGGR